MFIRPFFAAAIIVLLGAYLIPQSNFLRWRLFDAEYGMWQAKSRLLQDSYNQERIVILGDSRIVAAYMPKQKPGVDVVNLGLGGGTPIEAYYVLNRLIRGNTKIPMLVLSFSPTHFEHANTFLSRTMVFDFLDSPEIQDVLERQRDGVLLGKSIREYEYCKYGLPLCYKPYYKYLLIPGTARKSMRIYQDTYSAGGWHLFGTDSPRMMPGEVGAQVFKVDEINDLYFERLIRLAMKNNIPVNFYMTPLTQDAYSRISGNYRRQFIDYLRHKAPSMKIVDGGAVPLDHIGDGSHVNRRGAVFVTNYINDKLFGL